MKATRFFSRIIITVGLCFAALLAVMLILGVSAPERHRRKKRTIIRVGPEPRRYPRRTAVMC